MQELTVNVVASFSWGRRDRARLIGCHVGAPALRGCCRGCCPYPLDCFEDIVRHERYKFGPEAVKYHQGDYPNRSRINCINPYKPKFVCIDCRRCFKRTKLEGYEYDKSESGDIRMVRPDRETISQVWKAYRSMSNQSELFLKMERKGELYLDNLYKMRYKKYHPDHEEYVIPPDELEQLRQICPTFHWKVMGAVTCGKEGRCVGATFEAPSKTDDKEWKWVQEKLEAGEDFSYCMSSEEQLEAIGEGRRLLERKNGEDAWDAEKKRRIADLREAPRTGRRTEIEEQRLREIRKEREFGEEWVMVDPML